MNKERVALLLRIRLSLKTRLTELAKREHRSLNQEIEFLLERSLEDETIPGADQAQAQKPSRKPRP
ncbi:MAG: hypothetical protein DMG74_21670 [Acidobacteria bacterium]|nr:MAG: hypothetical protein DMG74_21670 [Acidobacteriota bacterium]